jgi:hypothetical protein
MCLFWVLCWCLQIVEQCGTVNILGDNFRNSRFGQFLFPMQLGEFPVRLLREFAGKGLDCLALIRAEWRKSKKFPVQREKPGILPTRCGSAVAELGVEGVA